MAGIAPAAARTLSELMARAGLSVGSGALGEVPVVTGALAGFRHRARLMVRGRAASPKIGIFSRGSHRIVDIPECPIHHPLINRVGAAVKGEMRSLGVAAYADRPHRGDLRSIQVVVERGSGRAQVVLVGNATSPAPLEALAARLGDILADDLHSLWWNGNPVRTNTILGPKWKHWSGPDAVRERIGAVDVYFPPGAFGQSNLEVADRLVRRVGEWVPDDARVVELYAGCGAIGLGLVGRSRSIVFNELHPDSLRGLEMGLAALPGAERQRARIDGGPAALCASRLMGADVVIADPPRKGLDPGLRAALCDRPPERFIYASCGLESFVRDCSELLASGRMRLVALEGFLFLPYTEHVETLGLFERC
jgi:tRNA/tmRNA/rRNA uracil-C5-methylase (TrmA/RlmC/RlmD family)